MKKQTDKLNWDHSGTSIVLRAGVHVIGEIVPFRDELISYEDQVDAVGDGVYAWIRKFTAPLDRPVRARLTLDFKTHHTPSYYMIPAVTYNGNEWGNGLEPKGLENEGAPWTFAWHRTAVAGATYSEGTEWSFALFGRTDNLLRGFSCSLFTREQHAVHRLIWPEEEGPLVYNDRDAYGNAWSEEWTMQPGETFQAGAYLVVALAKNPKTAWRHMLQSAWELNNGRTKPWYGPERIWELGIAYAKESLWSEDGEARAFAIGLLQSGEKLEKRRHYEIGWCGQNASFANSFLFDYLKFGNRDSLARGLAVLDSWVDLGRLDNGLLHCHLDYALFKQGGRELLDACNLGTAALQFMEAVSLARRCGAERPAYLETALGICDFAVRTQSDSGRIGKSWTCEGLPVDPNGTVGCFLIPAFVQAYVLTGEGRYLEAAESGYRFYIAELVENGFSTAGALDTYCVDKESSIPLLKAGLGLHDATGNPQYLKWAESAAWYLATWQWHHTVPYPKDSELSRLHYDTFGGTAVSTQHHHIDPFAVAFVEDWMRLADKTGNPVWRERAVAAWNNATIGISDGTLELAGMKRPKGSQDEGFYHTR